MGGHKKAVLAGANADWLRARIAAGPFTLRKLTAELAARGIRTHQKTVWLFVHTEGLSYKKNRAADGTVSSGYCPQTGALEGAEAQD